MNDVTFAKINGYIVTRNSKIEKEYYKWCMGNDKPFIWVKMNSKTFRLVISFATCNPCRAYGLNSVGFDRLADQLISYWKGKGYTITTERCCFLADKDLLEQIITIILQLVNDPTYLMKKPPRDMIWSDTGEDVPCPTFLRRPHGILA